jgi:hypothetical protein
MSDGPSSAPGGRGARAAARGREAERRDTTGRAALGDSGAARGPVARPGPPRGSYAEATPPQQNTAGSGGSPLDGRVASAPAVPARSRWYRLSGGSRVLVSASAEVPERPGLICITLVGSHGYL